LIFFRDGGFSDYRLWSPTADGPTALIRTHDPARFYFQPDLAYAVLDDIDPELAVAVERLVPGESDDVSAFRAESLLGNLQSYADMAERYRRFEELVTSEASFRPLRVTPYVTTLMDAYGIPQVHYALEIPHRDIGWRQDGYRLRSSFSFYCSIQDVTGREVDFIEDQLELDASTDVDSVPVSFQGRLILVPGQYLLKMTLRDTTGGRFATMSLPLGVPGLEGAGASELLVARASVRSSNGRLHEEYPFQLGDLIVSPSPDRAFPPREIPAVIQLWGMDKATPLTWSLSRGEEELWTRDASLPDVRGPVATLSQTVPLLGLPDGRYTLGLRYPGGERSAELEVGRSIELPSVRVVAREALPSGHGRIHYRRGLLFAHRGDTARAIEEMTRAARSLPQDVEIHLKLAFLLTATSQHDKVLEVLEPLEPYFPAEPDLLVFLGFASMKLGNLRESATYYGRALAVRPGDKKIESALARVRELVGH
jgi:hypothetical protein